MDDPTAPPSLLGQTVSSLLQFTTTAFAVQTTDGIFLDVNPAFCQLFEYTQAELVGSHHSLLTDPEDLEPTNEILAGFAQGRWTEHQAIKRCRTKTGRSLICQKKLSLLGEGAGKNHLILQMEDISREAQLQAENQVARQLLQSAIDALPGMVALWDTDLRNVFANQAYLEYFGWTPEQLRGHSIQELLGPELFAKNEPFMRKALAGEGVSFERTIPTPQGPRHTHAVYLPRWENGRVTGMFVFVTDNSELKQTQLNLTTILDAASDLGIVTFDAEGRIWLFNHGAELLLGCSAEDVLGSAKLYQFFDPDEVRSRELELAELDPAPQGVEVFIRPLDVNTSARKRWTLVTQSGERRPCSVGV